jgi:hypothetical protein
MPIKCFVQPVSLSWLQVDHSLVPQEAATGDCHASGCACIQCVRQASWCDDHVFFLFGDTLAESPDTVLTLHACMLCCALQAEFNDADTDARQEFESVREEVGTACPVTLAAW